MRSICRMCWAIGAWLEALCGRCQTSLGRAATQRDQGRTPGKAIPQDVRKWSAELFATIEEFKHSIAELEKLEETDEQV